jgi:hypothetical protein
MTDKTKKEGEALATPAPEQKTGGVVSSIGDKLLCYADEHPLKTTVGLSIAGGVAEEKVEEKLADEAVAAASGGVIDCAFNVISKAFDGVVD